MFNKDIQIREGAISKTNIIGAIWVNFGQVVLQKIVGGKELDGYSLSCGHSYSLRRDESPDIGKEVVCYRCGMLNAYRNFEHEWSHIIFKSSPAMFDRFIQLYANHYGSYEIVNLLALVIQAFDDIRVNSLWYLVYAGSATEIHERWVEAVNNSSEVNTNFITWLFAVALGCTHKITSGPFYDLVPIAKKAMDSVKFRGAANMLLVVRWFLEQCIDRLRNPTEDKLQSGQKTNKDASKKNEGNESSDSSSKEDKNSPVMSRDEAVQQIAKDLHDLNRAQTHHLIDKADYVSKIAYRLQKEEEISLSKIMKFIPEELKQEEIPDLDPQGVRRPIDGEMEDAVKSLQQNEGDATQNQYLLNDVENVLMADVLPEHILPESIISLGQEQQDDVNKMRAVFAKFIGKKIARLVEDGDEINIQSLIQYRLDGQNDEVFEDEGLDRGFAYLTLCDMSDSMDGVPFNYVCLGSEMLKKALDYPFVEGHLWGFRGAIGLGSENYVTTREKILAATKGGEVWIYKYNPKCGGYFAKEVETVGTGKFSRDKIPVKCGGMTPTPTALHLAVKYLVSSVPSGMEKKIFLLTDGNPTQVKLDGGVPREVLLRAVRKEINAARNKGIRIYTTILGNEVTDKDAYEMFGPQIFWKRVPSDMIGQALLETVITQFVSFLRR